MEKVCSLLPFSKDNGHHARPIWEDWHDRLPVRPLCADHFADGTTRRPRTAALGYRNIEINPPGRVAWLCFDIDRSDAIFAADEGDLPGPNVAMVNPRNGHAHLAYALETPVGIAGRSRMGPIGLLRDVERGMIGRLGADPSYVGRFAKTPNHRAWKTVWLTPKPFALGDLIERVGPRSDRQLLHRQELIGHSRNVELFDATREVAYREFASFELRVGHLKSWSDRVLEIATAWNSQFDLPLPSSEVRSIAKSIAVWTWRNFSTQEFSQIQSNRAKRGNEKRGVETLDKVKVISEVKSVTLSIASKSMVYPDMVDDLLAPAEKPRSAPMSEYCRVTGRSPRTIRRHQAVPRDIYEKQSLSRQQPWKALGISRRTWERRRKQQAAALNGHMNGFGDTQE